MKKLILIIALFLGFIAESSAQIKPSAMSPATVASFRSKLGINAIEADTVTAKDYFYTESEVDTKTRIGFTIKFDPTVFATPVDATTYYYGAMNGLTLSTAAGGRQQLIPFNCTLKKVTITSRTTAGASQETWNVYVRINNTTDVLIFSGPLFSSSASTQLWITSADLSTSITAGDKIEMKVVFPTMATDATAVYLTTELYFQNR